METGDRGRLPCMDRLPYKCGDWGHRSPPLHGSPPLQMWRLGTQIASPAWIASLTNVETGDTDRLPCMDRLPYKCGDWGHRSPPLHGSPPLQMWRLGTQIASPAWIASLTNVETGDTDRLPCMDRLPYKCGDWGHRSPPLHGSPPLQMWRLGTQIASPAWIASLTNVKFRNIGVSLAWFVVSLAWVVSLSNVYTGHMDRLPRTCGHW